MKLNTDLCLFYFVKKKKKSPGVIYSILHVTWSIKLLALVEMGSFITHLTLSSVFVIFLFVLVQATYVLRLRTGATYSVIAYNFIS